MWSSRRREVNGRWYREFRLHQTLVAIVRACNVCKGYLSNLTLRCTRSRPHCIKDDTCSRCRCDVQVRKMFHCYMVMGTSYNSEEMGKGGVKWKEIGKGNGEVGKGGFFCYISFVVDHPPSRLFISRHPTLSLPRLSYRIPPGPSSRYRCIASTFPRKLV